MLKDNKELILEKKIMHQKYAIKKKSNFQCEFYEKGCLVCAGSGLKRHVIQKHPPSKAQETLSSDFIDSDKVPTADIKLEPLFLRGFFEKIGSR